MFRRSRGQSVHRIRPLQLQHELYGLPGDQKFDLAAQSSLSRETRSVSRHQLADNLLRLLDDHQRMVSARRFDFIESYASFNRINFQVGREHFE